MQRTLVTVLLLACAGLVAATCGEDEKDDDGGGGSDGERVLVLAPIDALELVIRESDPPQYAVHITSGLPNGCARFEDAVLVAPLEIRVRNSMPSDPNTACTAIYGQHEETVNLGTDFVAGQEYVVRVNDKELRFTAQ